MSDSRLNIPLKCKCGTLQGFADVPVSHRGNRFVCLCDDCQAYAHYLGRAQEVLDANGGTDIFPVAPANLKITQGIENLKGCRLSDKGMYRWYAGCCKTPIGNTPASAKSIYVGVSVGIIDSSMIGPISVRVQGKFGIGPLPAGTVQMISLPFMFRMIRFMLGAALKKQHSPSPFVDSSTGRLRAEPSILSSSEREVLRPLCGPKNLSSQK
ncbi:hypothetical protein D3C87_1047400 [compost metagenome]